MLTAVSYSLLMAQKFRMMAFSYFQIFLKQKSLTCQDLH